MSLADCFKQFGKAIDTKDAQSIQSRADELVASGMDLAEAENQAIVEHIDNLDAELQDIANRAEQAGAEVAYEQPEREAGRGPAVEQQAGQTPYAAAAGRDDAAALAEFERAKAGEPVTFTHRTAGVFDQFDNGLLGKNTSTPSANLGHFLSAADVGNPQRYGPELKVFEFSLQNPIVVSAEAFESATADKAPEEVLAMRDSFMEMGHDGVLVEGLNWAIVFDAATVSPVQEDLGFQETQLRQSTLAQAQRNDIGMYSAVEKAVLEMNIQSWKNDKPASGKEIWNKLKKEPGVKAEELDWLGIENFLKAGDKFSRDDVVQYIQQNGVSVEETVAEGEAAETEIEWLDREVWDDAEAWEHDVDYYEEEAEINGLRETAIENIANRESDYIEANKDEDESIEDYLDREFSSELESEIRELAEVRAREAYFENPIYIRRSEDFSDGSELIIFGNDDIGYSVRTDLHYNSVVADDIWSEPEAEIRAQEYAVNNDLIVGEESFETPRWSEYITEGDYENYRELKLKLPDIDEEFIYDAHFGDEPNIVAFLRVTDRELASDIEAAEVDEIPVSYRVYQIGTGLIHEGRWVVIASAPGRKNQHSVSFGTEEEARAYMDDEKSKGRVVTVETPKPLNKTYFIDEFQSDWHQQGRKTGYKTGEVDAGELEDKAREIRSKAFDEYTDSIDQRTEEEIQIADKLKRLVGTDSAVKAVEMIVEGAGVDSDQRKEGFKLIKQHPALLALGNAVDESNRLMKAADAERYGVPDAPFKGNNWMTLGLKRAIIDAVDQGYEAVAWADANVLSDRWSESYRTLYETQYDTKMPSMIKKLTGVQPVHLTMEGEPVKAAESRDKYAVEKSGEYYIITENGEPHFRENRYSTAEQAEGAIDVIVSRDNTEPGYWIIPITDELKAKIKDEGLPLFQEERGSLTLLDNQRILRLSKASDLSTFIHEAGHLFLEMEKVFAAKYGATEDQKTILEWLGAESFDEVIANTERGREMHEKFAETFEVYAREGKAPSLALRDAFEAFARWLRRIYTTLVGDPRLARADLNDDIRQVFDRMLATEAEIEQAAGNPAYDQLFRSAEQAGMTDEQYKKYLDRVQKAKARAQGDLYSKIVQQIKSRETKAWKEEKQPIYEEELERLSRAPVYQVIKDLKENPLDIDAVKEILGIEKMTGRLIGKAKNGGVDPQEYAEVYGYSTAKAMLEDILQAEGLKKAAADAAEARMVDKHGDILNDGTIEQLAQEALHNTVKADTLLAELKALNRGKPVIDRDILKAQAKTLIGRMKFKEIQPNKYYRAEIKAAQKAATETDPAAKIEAKTQQLANHYLYREAVKAREKMTRNRRYVKKVQGRQYDTKQVDPAYVQNMKVLANLYDMSHKAERQMAGSSILEWYESQINDPNQYVNLELMDLNLIEALNAKSEGRLPEYTFPIFDDLTADELQSVVDMLKHLRYVGGVMSEDGKAEFSATKQKIANSILEEGGKDADRRFAEEGKHDRTLNAWKHFYHRLPSMRNLIRILDGFKDGPVREEIYAVMEDAANRKLDLKEQLYDKYEELMGGHYNLSISKAGRTEETIVTEDGRDFTLTSQGRFMLAMYWGTESSREAIRQGFGLTDRDVMNMLSYLTPEQLELVNATWKVNESLWPELSKTATNMLGAAPPKLDPAPFEVNGVKMTGGHMRLFYRGTEIEFKEERKSGGEFMKVTPSRAGSTYSRVGSGGRQVSLEISNLHRAWDDTIHYVAFSEAGRKLSGILNSKEVRGAIEQKHGESFYRALIETTEMITSNRKERDAVPMLASIMNISRRALTAKYLMYSLRNVVQQVTSLPIAFAEVGSGRWTQHALLFATNRAERVEYVNQKSSFMRNRAQLVNREAREFLKQTTVDSKLSHIWNEFARYGFTPQTAIDSIIAYPAWMAQYEQSMEIHGDERRAVSDADTAVAESVGSGSDLHLGGIYQENNPEWVKAITLMGSWMNMIYQRIYRSSKGMQEFNADVFRDAVTMPIFVAAISAAIVFDMPEDKDEPSEWLKWLMARYAGFLGGTIPVLRDIVSAFSGFKTQTPLSAATGVPYKLTQEVESVIAGRQSKAKFAADVIAGTVTTIVPIPGSGNITRLMNYWESYEEGKEGRTFNPLQAVIEGADKND